MRKHSDTRDIGFMKIYCIANIFTDNDTWMSQPVRVDDLHWI